MRIRYTVAALVMSTVAVFAIRERASAVGTAFTYQGQVQLSGTPATGACDLQVSLFDALSGGAQIGSTQTVNSVPLTSGVFSVPLDFGVSAFGGADRFLQLAARCPAGSGGFISLSPRQAVTATPYALFSQNIADGAVTSAKLGSNAVGTTQMQDSAVTSAKIADSSITSGDVGFNFAASASKGGPASDVACSACVVSSELSPTGSTNGQVLTSNGAAVNWQSPAGFVLPVDQTTATASPAFQIHNTGTGDGVQGFSPIGAGVRGESASGTGVVGKTTDGHSAVYGYTTAGIHGVIGYNEGAGDGVRGESVSGSGVVGKTNTGHSAVFGYATAGTYGVIGYNEGAGEGVHGESVNGTGVVGRGTGANGVGVQGVGTSGVGTGVHGLSARGSGVRGEVSILGTGVRGSATATVSGTGVFGESTGGIGVFGVSTTGAGVTGRSTTGPAGDFLGRVAVAGDVAVTGAVTAAAESRFDGGLRALNGLVATTPAGGFGVAGGRAASLSGHTTLAGTRIDNDGGGPALEIGTSSGTGGIGIRIVSDGDAIRAEGRIVTASGFHGPCNFPQCNSDVAESFATARATESGDVVALVGATGEPTVRKTARPYEALLIGVVSTSPGLVFDEGMTRLAGDNTHLITATKTVVGMVGKVPTKVCMENGPIAVSDPLTSSSTPGVAMRASKAGKIIGYALEPATADGKILVWLEPGQYLPPEVLDDLNRFLADNG